MSDTIKSVNHAWYSEEQAEKIGYNIRRLISGEEVKVSTVTHSLECKSGWKDIKYVGIITNENPIKKVKGSEYVEIPHRTFYTEYIRNVGIDKSNDEKPHELYKQPRDLFKN